MRFPKKLQLIIAVAVLSVFLVIEFFAIRHEKDMLIEQAKASLKQRQLATVELMESYIENNKVLEEELLEEQKNKLQSIVESAYSIVEHFYETAEAGHMTMDEAKQAQLEQIKGIKYGADGYIFVNNSQNIVIWHPKTSIIGKDLSNVKDEDGVYFVKELTETAIKGGGFVTYKWPKPGEEKSTPKLSYALYFKPWDWVIGSGLYLDDVQKTLEKAEKTAWGRIHEQLFHDSKHFPAIFTEDGVMVAYVKREIEGKRVKFYDAKTGADVLYYFTQHVNDFYTYYYQVNGKVKQKIAYISYIPEKKWYVVYTDVVDDLMAPVYKAILGQILFGIFGIILIIIGIMLLVSTQLNSVLKQTRNAVEEIASGELRNSIITKRKDEFGEILKQLETLRQHFIEIVQEIQNQSEDTLQESNELQKISQKVIETVNAAQKLLKIITHSIDNLASVFEEVTSGSEEVASSAQLVSETSQALSQESSALNQKTKEGLEKIQSISAGLEHLYKNVSKSTTAVSKLIEKINGVRKILDMINSIAEQTNLLALNAAIEAQRAGQQGKGFAVVADEIRKLAEESKKATAQIENLLGDIGNFAESTTTEINKVKEKSKHIKEANEVINDVFSELENFILEIDNKANSLAQSQEEQSAAAEEIASAIDNTMKSLTEIQKETQGFSDKINELAEVQKTLSKSVKKLEKQQQNLQNRVEFFKI